MFSLKFLVKDKDFAPVMHYLAGKAFNLEWSSVTNVEEPKAAGPLKAVTPNGSTVELLQDFLHKNMSGKEVTTQDMRRIGESLGKTKGATSQAISHLVKTKFLKRLGKAQYIVNKG